MHDTLVKWDSLEDVAAFIHGWANSTFPGRHPKSSLLKLNMEEIPELLTHLKRHGTEGIGEEWADCMILLLDLAKIWGIDPSTAIREKMLINNNRMWAKDPHTGFFNHVVIAQPPITDFKGAEDVRKKE